MFGLGKVFFINRVRKAIAPGKKLEEIPPLDYIIIKVLIIAYTLRKNKEFHYLNYNKISLYDTCLFISYVIRLFYFNQHFINFENKQNFDDELLAYLSCGFEKFFKCPAVTNTDVNISRFEYYDTILEEYEENNDKKDIMAVFNEFQLIIKCDIIENRFIEFTKKSPLYTLNSLEKNMMCDLETKYALEVATENFKKEISSLVRCANLKEYYFGE